MFILYNVFLKTRIRKPNIESRLFEKCLKNKCYAVTLFVILTSMV